MGVKPEDIERAIASGNRVLAQLRRVCPYPHEIQTDSPIPNPQPKRHQAQSLGKAIPRETEGVPRPVVRIVGFRCRPLDPDNFAASVKDLLDGLRHAGLIGGDEYWRISLETSQRKVDSLKEERTEIELDLP